MKRNHASLKIFFSVLLLLCLSSQWAEAQFRRNADTNASVTFEDVYDDPYDINKLFVKLQPLYGELFTANINTGFGLEAQYFLQDKMDFKLHIRRAYGERFDLTRDVAMKISDMDNVPIGYNYYEFGGTYHIKDQAFDTEGKITLYAKRYNKDNKWAAHVPDNIMVPSKVRKIIGARMGAFHYTTSTDLNRAMANQKISLVDQEGMKLDSTLNIYGNLSATSLYIGGSMSWFRNFAKKVDSYGTLVNDQLLTVFFDIMYAPVMSVSDLYYDNVRFSADPIKLNHFGARLGIDGMFNRELGWGYGGEVGYRPSLQTRSFYATVKISFPVYGTQLSHRREAFGK